MYITHLTHGAGARPSQAHHQQQPGYPHRMPTSACTSRGKAEGGTCKSPPQKKGTNKQQSRGGMHAQPRARARRKKKGGARDSHTTKRPRTHSTRGGQTPQPGNTKGHTRGAPRKNTGGLPSQIWRHLAESSGPPEERRPRTRRHTPHPRNSAPPRKRKKHRRNANERGRGEGDQEAQDRDRQQRAPQSHDTTGPRTEPLPP